VDRSSRGWAYLAFPAAGKRLQDADRLVRIQGPDLCVQSVVAAAVGCATQRTHPVAEGGERLDVVGHRVIVVVPGKDAGEPATLLWNRLMHPSCHLTFAGYRLVWRILLLEAAGLVTPTYVDVPKLRVDAEWDLHDTHALFVKLAGIRVALADWLDVPALPMALSQQLLTDYCRLER
jgi:hypothetical protein